MAQKRIIDKRKKEKFMVDDEYLNGMARLCGWQGTIVYNSLCRHSAKDQTCFPSINLMAEQHGVSRPTILKGLSELEKRKVIKIETVRTKSGKHANNTYTLLDKSEWDYIPGEKNKRGKNRKRKKDGTFVSQVNDMDMDSRVHKNTPPSPQEYTTRVNVMDCKETHVEGNTLKETHTITNVIEAEPQEYGDPEINWVIKKFEEVMGFNSMGRKQKDRYCAQHLLSNFDKKQIEAMLLYCTSNEYAPRIGSVEKLWYKRGDVIAGIKSLQNKSKQHPKSITI